MIRVLLVSVTAGLILTGAKANTADGATTLLQRCWRPDQLAATVRERHTVRRRDAADKQALRLAAPGSTAIVAASPRGSIRRVEIPDGRKLVALTFDLCETPFSVAGYDGRIVDYLRAHDVRATFFASGKWIRTHEERAHQLMADPRFEIGNHGFEHRDFRRLTGGALSDEIVLAQASYGNARSRLADRACVAQEVALTPQDVPERMTLFRFPYGTCNAKSLDAVAAGGLLAIQWDVVSGDPERTRSARAIAAGILNAVKPGSIVVAHANGRGWNTAAALPLIIPKLKALGYEFVTVSELLAAGKPVVAETCYERRPGDNRHVNTAVRPQAKKPKGPTDSVRRTLLQLPD